LGLYTVPNVYYTFQSTAQTCWRAGYEMLLRYKGKDPTLAHRLPNAAQMATRGIMDHEFYGCASALGLGGIRYTYFKDISLLEHALRSWGPVWVSGFFFPGTESKHIVVIGGVDVDDRKVLAYDPWRAYTGAQGKPVLWSFSYFSNNINPVPWACQLWY